MSLTSLCWPTWIWCRPAGRPSAEKRGPTESAYLSSWSIGWRRAAFSRHSYSTSWALLVIRLKNIAPLCGRCFLASEQGAI